MVRLVRVSVEVWGGSWDVVRIRGIKHKLVKVALRGGEKELAKRGAAVRGAGGWWMWLT